MISSSSCLQHVIIVPRPDFAINNWYLCNIDADTVLGTSEFCAKKLQIMRAIFANSTQTLRNISPRFSIVKLFVTPVYYPEYRGLLVHLR